MKKFNETKKMMKKMMPAMEQPSSKKGKGKKGKRARGRNRGFGIPGTGGMSMADLRKIQEMMEQ